MLHNIQNYIGAAVIACTERHALISCTYSVCSVLIIASSTYYSIHTSVLVKNQVFLTWEERVYVAGAYELPKGCEGVYNSLLRHLVTTRKLFYAAEQFQNRKIFAVIYMYIHK